MPRVNPSPPPLLYTVNGACKALGMSRATFYKKVRVGLFHILKDDSRSVVAAEEVTAYAARIKTGHGAQA